MFNEFQVIPFCKKRRNLDITFCWWDAKATLLKFSGQTKPQEKSDIKNGLGLCQPLCSVWSLIRETFKIKHGLVPLNPIDKFITGNSDKWNGK